MQIIKRPYIVYSLPTSKIHQPLRSRKLPIAWEEIRIFLEKATTTVLSKPDDINIEILPPLIKNMNDPVLMNILNNSTPKERLGVWKIEAENLNPAIKYFEIIQSTLKTNYDIMLHLSYSFKLSNPSNQQKLEFQELTSSFSVYFAKTHICLPTLYFPFQEADENFWNYIDVIKQYLPFTLEEKYLRLARIKNESVSSFKKIERLPL
ncbi:MAG: hypothetical protein ABIN67_04570 [Ferruginibacter sp.]